MSRSTRCGAAISLIFFSTLPASLLAQQAPDFQVLHRFEPTGTNAASPWAPPVWLADSAQIVGVTRGAGESYQANPYGFGMMAQPSGLAYQLQADGSGFNSVSLGALGGEPLSTIVAQPGGTVVSGASFAALDPADPATQSAGIMLRLDETLQLSGVRPDGTVNRGFQVRGQHALDGDGNLYVASGENALWRLSPAGALTALINFEDYRGDYQGQGISYPTRGGAPIMQVWSEVDDALYIVSGLSWTGNRPLVNGSQMTGQLVRVSGEGLRSGVGGDDIEVLFLFTQATGGAAFATDSGMTALVEAGDFLYGTSNNGVWRLRKSGLEEGVAAADTFALLHSFSADLTSARENQWPASGSGPHGPLVLAADGHLYGTTLTDDGTVQPRNQAGALAAAGAGTIFRIVIGEQPDRSDDALEFIHAFRAEDGSQPVGLSVGPVDQGRQWLIGATLTGGQASDGCFRPGDGGTAPTVGCTGEGTVFTFGVVPQPGSVSLSVSPDGAVAVGDALTLSWSTARVAGCEASASATDVTDWQGALAAEGGSLTVTAVAGSTDYWLTCDGLDGTSVSDSVRVTVAEAGGGRRSSGGGGAVTPWLIGLGLLLGGRRIRH